MIREAYDLGINFFDVYDHEGRTYQYEPMGSHLAPMINDVVISITMYPFEGRTVEQELERDLRLFRRDYIDLVRLHAWKNSNDEKVLAHQAGHKWEWWETLFKLKEKGYIRAVGVPIHNTDDLEQPLAELPIDFVILPFNFYHNWYRMQPNDFDSTITTLRNKGIGVITMKPMLGDRLVTPFHRIAAHFDESGEINFARACLRYVINSNVRVDSTLNGMFNPFHVYNNLEAFFKPEISDEERTLLKEVRNAAKINNVTKTLLPEYYRFLEDWSPDSFDDSDLFDSA
jgi:predicted aldo/keto reductase-like oxidoreductase